MTNALAPQRKATRPPPQPLSALRVQTSAAGQLRLIGYGQVRIAANLIGDYNFAATAVYAAGTGGGKFGGGSAREITGYNYSASLMFGLGEGPVLDVPQYWEGSTPLGPTSNGMTLFDGSYQQGPWSWLENYSPGYAQNFRGLAYMASEPYALGNSANVPNVTFETRFAISGAVYEIAQMHASPPTYSAQYFDVTANGALENVTVPVGSPFEVQAQNPRGLPFTQTYVEGLASGSNLPPDPATGVFYTDTEPPQFLTLTTGTPSTGSYSVTGGGLYTFSSGDAGAAVTIVDLAVSPGVNYVSLGTGTISAGSTTVTGLTIQSTANSGVSVGSPVLGPGIPAGALAASLDVSAGTITLSLPAFSGGTVALAIVGDALDQVVVSAPAAGQFRITPQGAYTFSTADLDNGFQFETPSSGNVFVVPSGITSVGSVEAIGAGAGGGFGGPGGGGGAYAKIGSFSVTPGQTLYLSAGAGTAGATNSNTHVAWAADSWLSNGIGGATTSLVQSLGTSTNTSPAVLTFTASPSAGNLLVFVVSNTGSIGGFAPPTGLVERGYYESDGPQGLYVYQRVVQSGDPAAWSFTHSNGVSIYGFEISGAGYAQIGMRDAGTPSPTTAPVTGTASLGAMGSGIGIACFAVPQSTGSFTAAAGWTALPLVGNANSASLAAMMRSVAVGAVDNVAMNWNGVGVFFDPTIAVTITVNGATGAGSQLVVAAGGQSIAYHGSTLDNSGGPASLCIGTLSHSGGNGTFAAFPSGGGGAAGPNGAGAASGYAANNLDGGGGGGADGGAAGSNSSGSTPGAGGTSTQGGAGGNGGNDNGGNAQAGVAGTEYLSSPSYGAGGGGGGAGLGFAGGNGGNGGNYGGGGGAAGGNDASATGGMGAGGLIVIAVPALNVIIWDVPDANPADVLRDFLTNQYYGVPGFDPARLGDLSTYAEYCVAAGLWVSPTLATAAAAANFLADLMTATNSELVWSGGKLTPVPYGDVALSANGASYAPSSSPLYSIGDGDIMPNEATNPNSVSAADSPDPVTTTRSDPTLMANDVQIEFLDRANAYNPDIVEVQDDASVNQYGVRTAGKKQLHLFCDHEAALASAQLQLGRQQAINTVAFTLDRRFILLDPMDIIEVTDPVTYPGGQRVRIREITENTDRTLSVIAEEYQQGTGTAASYNATGGGSGIGGAGGAGPTVRNTAADPGDALAPVIIDLPTQLVGVLGSASALATNGGANWGGCEVWTSSDDVNFYYAGSMTGGTTMGTLSASFGSTGDPDTTVALAVDLTESRGALLPGSDVDADAGNTVCYVDGEFVSYSAATLIAQYQYSLGTYLRRGQYGSTITAHASGSSFVRLRAGTLFQLPYDASQIGKTVYVKLLSFNLYGGGLQTLDQVGSAAHTIGGSPPSLSALGVPSATNIASNTGASGSATTSGVTLAAATISIAAGTTTISLSTALGAGSGGATAAAIAVKRGATTIYTSASYALPAAGNLSVSFNIQDASPGTGSVAYSAVATTNAGTAPVAASTLVVVGLTG